MIEKDCFRGKRKIEDWHNIMCDCGYHNENGIWYGQIKLL